MIRFLLEKEFKQLFRNRFLPKLIVAMPTVILLVLPWALNQEVKQVRLDLVDNDHTTTSRLLREQIVASGYFRLNALTESGTAALTDVEQGLADAILEIPPHFEKALMRQEDAGVQVSVNAVNGTKGSLTAGYLVTIVQRFASARQAQLRQGTAAPALSSLNRFNPRLDYKVYMIPALMVMLLTMLTGFLPALNIVGEKEAGTIEQLNVTPVGKFTFILAKLIPYWIIGFVVLSLCMGIAALVYGLSPSGSLLTIYLYAGIYVAVVSGLGLVISNYSDTLQQAMFVIFFFVMILVLMSGLFTPVSSMPRWAQWVTYFNPLRYFMEVMRGVFLKGSAMADLLPQLFALAGFAVVFNAWAVMSYRKRR
ncbi:MAG: ABC transporter permease [Prevotellaceae bacterium]|jgi:ABC-2 type transport system permease protein|nr:ABC transporter permease [Prevotellaceae bacterium]